MSIFECKALTKNYGAKTVLDSIDLTIEPGRIVGLLGPNGSGKTTLIKLANGLLTPTSGEILIAGKAPCRATKAIVSYLPDRNTLPGWMTIAQALDYYGDFYSDFRRGVAEAMLMNLGLDRTQKIKTLSKGMREKTQLILTMSRDAKLYLLDEPIGGVDPATRDYILRTIIGNYSAVSYTHLYRYHARRQRRVHGENRPSQGGSQRRAHRRGDRLCRDRQQGDPRRARHCLLYTSRCV